MYKNFLITESEKNEIKKLYGLIPEQNVINKEKTKEISINFAEGKWKVENYKDQIDKALNEIRNFVKQNRGDIIEVTINASESYIPNYDTEVSPKKPLNPGDLSKFRSESIEKYLNTNAKDILSSIQIKKISGANGPKWDPEKDKSVYQPYQYVKLTIKATSEVKPNPLQCLTDMEIEFNYTDLSQGHRCNNATYQLYFTNSSVTQPTEQDLLIRLDGAKYASLDNNGSIYDNNSGTCKTDIPAYKNESCKRYNKFKITSEIIERIGGSNLTPDSKFKIWAKCVGTTKSHPTFGTGCHYDLPYYNEKKEESGIGEKRGIGEFTITSGMGNITNSKVYTPVEKDKISLLLEIEPCGSPVS
jgi:hypothetical protein